MKTKKLNLNDLKVESFTTSIKNKQVEAINVNTLKGGGWGMTMCCTFLTACGGTWEPTCPSETIKK